MRIVVVGGGFAGLSAAARLAKLRHEVTVLEASHRVGGRLLGHALDDGHWDLAPPTVTLPGVLRDLFRKSGRTMDRTIGFTPGARRRHLFTTGTVLDLPFGTRGAQVDAVTRAFGHDRWSPWLDTLPPVWDAMRRRALDQVFDGRADRDLRRALLTDRTVQAETRRHLGDSPMSSIVLDDVLLRGDSPRRTPAMVAVTHYLDRNFSRWTLEGGPAGLARALDRRLAERRVTVHTRTRADHVEFVDGQVTAVHAAERAFPADLVVWCAPSAPGTDRRLRPRPPRTLHHVSLDHALDGPWDITVHGPHPVRAWSSDGRHWTAHGGDDPLGVLAAVGLDWRPNLVTATPAPGHDGWQWRGWRTALRRPGVAPRGNLYVAGAAAHPEAGLELVGMATAAIAADVTPAPRS